MCGRVAQAKNPVEYGSMLKVDFTRRIPNSPPHYNGAPGQDYLIARSHPETQDTTIDLIRWGLLPSWAKDRKIAYKLINRAPKRSRRRRPSKRLSRSAVASFRSMGFS